MANTEQARQMAEYRRQLRLNTLQNLKNGGASQGIQTNVTPPQQTTNFVGDIAKTVSNFGESLNETGLDIVGHVSKGLFKGLEGIYDAGAGLVGTVGGWFSDNFEEKVKNHIAIDGSENVFGWLYEATDDSYINKMGEKGQNITRGVAQGIGQMLPSIIVTVVTHGAGASTMASQIAGMGTFAAGATGGATEEAVQGGADLDKAMGYGIASGALETAIEKASGNVPWDDIAKGAIKGAGKSALSKATSTFFSEGVEEVASDVLNPALKRVTGVDREATIDYSKLPETFAIGGLTGVTMGGASRGITNLKYNKAGGSKFVSMAEELDSIRENEVKLAEFQENKKHTAEQVEDYAKRVDTDNYESIQRISETLKFLPANKRGNAFLTAPDLHNIFEANGEIKADIQNNFKDVSNMNVSAGIRHQTSKLNEVLKGVNERHNTNFELDTDKLNDTERTTLAKVTNAVSRLAKSSKYKAYAGLDVAIIKNAKNENAFIKDGVIYLSREHLSSGEWAKHVAHEVTHFTEGSKEYNAFAKFLTEDAQAVNHASEAISKQGYGYTAEQVKDALAKVNRGETLTESEQEAYSELISHIAEEILGNEDSINRLTAKNKSLANRIYERIKSFLRAFTGTNADKETVARLRKAEKLFAKALENTGKAQAEMVKELSKEGFEVSKDAITLNFSPQFNRKTWQESGKDATIEALKQQGFQEEDINKQINKMDNILNLMEEFTKGEGFEVLKRKFDLTPMLSTYADGRQVLSVLVANGDYVVNFDLSTECKKREYYAKVISILADEGFFEKTAFDADDIASIQMIMREQGYEMPCLMCFVENRRQYMANWARELSTMWNDAVKGVLGEDFNEYYNFAKGNVDADLQKAIKDNYDEVKKLYQINVKGDVKMPQTDNKTKMAKVVATMDKNTLKLLQASDFVTEEGVKNLKANLYNVYSMASSSYGAGTPKIANGFTPYNSEILKLLPKFVKETLGKDLKVGKYTKQFTELKGEEKTIAGIRQMLYDIGGARFQSFSDAQIEEVFDILQLVLDASARKYPMHYYSKEIWEHKLLGLTGAKANGSLISTIDNTIGNDYAGLRELKGEEIASTGIEIAVAVDSEGKPLKDKNGLPKITKKGENSRRFAVEFADYRNPTQVTAEDSYTKKVYSFAVTHSIGYKDAIALQLLDGYSSNFGTIAIGFSDAHILAMLDSPYIRMVIPYHASGMVKAFGEMLKINTVNDYTEYQSNKPNIVKIEINGEEITKTGDESEIIKKLSTDFVWNKVLQETKDINATVKQYLEFCDNEKTQKVKVNGNTYNVTYTITPKFAKFRNHPNYYKVLTDFNIKDCITEEVAMQGDVNFVLPEANSYTEEQLQAYKQRLMDTGIFTKSEVDRYAEKANLSANEIIAKQLQSQENYRKAQDAVMPKTMDLIHEHFEKRYGVKASSDIRFSRKEKTTELPVVDISVDEELTQRIANSEKSIITTIQNYIFEKYGNYTFNLSDGKKAKIDNSDAKKLGYTAKEAKQAQISNLIELVENAKFIIETNKVKHNKFNAFSYYAIKANYKGQIYELAINVGRTKNDFSWHIYEINELPKIIKYIKKELPAEHLSVWGGFESFSLKNSSLFNPTITQENEDVKSFNENSQEKFSRKEVKQGETEFLTEMPQEKKTVREKVVDNSKETWINLQTQLTNQQAGLEKELKRLGVKDAEAKTHLARASYNAGQIILEEGFIDENGNVIGKSLQDIWNPVYKKGEEYQREFNEYLFNYLHIDRLKVDKGILNNVTEKQAKERISQLEAQHPEFKQLAKDVWQYNKNLMKERIKLGLVTDEVADYMNNMYPHYVPAFTEGQENKQSISSTSSNNTVKQTIKGAKGSVDNKLPPDVIMARQTMEVMRAGRLNQLLNSLYDGVVQKGDNTNVSVVKIEQRWQPNKTKDAIKEAKKNANEVLDLMNEDYSTYDNQPHQYTFYRGSEKITISVSDDIDIGLSAFKPNQEYRNTLINLVTKSNDIFKRLVTSANPFFLGRNAIRDLQEALFYSKAPVRFIGYWIKAYKQILTNGEYWRLYKSLGGMSSGLFDYNTGIQRFSGVKGVYKNALAKLEKANMIVEQAPRLAEFIISMERGASAEQALLDSAEVTTNFSRGGKTAKFLNRTVMPFLNPSIQGWSKLYRTVTAKKTIEEWGMLILKALVLGIGVSALNDLLLGDDEEYQSLSIRDKENNYLIKIGDNFLKLPKGRVLSVFGSLWIRGREQAKGNENAWDGYLSSVSSAVSPVDSFSRTIFSPITDAKTNTTWYGGQIEGRQFENLAPEDRYDESTSSIAIFLGKTFGTSPKKVHYVIDQYSGVIGDVVLPATTKKAERGLIKSNFIIDSTLSTRYQNEFYTALDEAYFAKNKGDINANYIVRYLNSISTEVSDMYATKREIERSDKSNADKQAETKVIQSLINTTNKTALEGAKVLETAVKGLNVEQQNKLLQSNNKFLKLDENAQKRAIQKLNDYYYALAMNKAFGIELEEKYTKYSKFNSPELFVYLTEIGSIEGDKDKQGNTISGSRKANILKYLKSKGVTSAKQDIILDILGYSTTTK